MLKNQTGIEIAIKVLPKASKNQLVGWENGELKIRLAAVPEKGEANRELLSFLSKTLKLAKTRITLIYGEKSRHKRVFISGITKEQLEQSILSLCKEVKQSKA